MNEELAAIDRTGFTRLLFIGLWCASDGEGRLEDRPTRLKAEILPYDDVDVPGMLDALTEHGFIQRYEAAGKRFIFVRTFGVNQRISVKEKAAGSEYPPPPDWSPPPVREPSGPRGPAPTTRGQRVYERDKEEHGQEHADINAGGDKGTAPVAPPVVDPVPVPPGGNGEPTAAELARAVLEHLNAATGRPFRAVPTNLKLITARLAEDGVTFEGVKTMIDRQVLRWKGTDQEEYLRPETLFGKTKFESYYASKDAPIIHETNTSNGRRAHAGGYNPNAQLAGAETDDYAALGRSIGAPPGAGAELPAEPDAPGAGDVSGAAESPAPADSGLSAVPPPDLAEAPPEG